MKLEKYSLGIGDRFAFEGAAQLRALQRALDLGVRIAPVWNKSHREHMIIGTEPADTRRVADEAVRLCKWPGPHYVDADHIGLKTVDRFIASSDFFTIDVADFIGVTPDREATAAFVKDMQAFKGRLAIPGVSAPFDVTDETLNSVATKYLAAVQEAGRVYRHIVAKKTAFIPEVSFDEATSSQTPAELLLILGAIAREGIPLQTIAPKFSGSFLKGVDYVGDVRLFVREFEDDLAVIAHAIKTFRLPANLKLSVHSGSDKFSLYPHICKAMQKFNAGVHLKTSGTTWLEEVAGLAASGGDPLQLVKNIYSEIFKRREELCAPYLTVIDIDETRLPDPAIVQHWSPVEFVEALQHNQASPRFNTHFRQLFHVGYKVAADLGQLFRDHLVRCRAVVESNVTTNLFDRHILPLFLGQRAEQQSGYEAEELHGRRVARA